MTKVDPTRLGVGGGTPARLGRALEQARKGPHADSLERLSGALGVAAPFAPPPVPPPSGLPVAAGASKVFGILGATVVVAAGAGVGTFVATRPAPPVVPQAAPRVEAAPRVAPVVPAPAAEQPAAEAETELAPLVVPPPASRRRKSDAEPTAAEPVTTAEPEPVAAPSAPADAASRLRDEALLVRNAERLLGSDPARALALTEERRRRFPGGALGQEAEVVAINALLKLGRRDAAAARAKSFEASHPGSLHVRRIRALLGQDP